MQTIKYNCIYADPPWKFRNFNRTNTNRGARKEYPTVALKEMKSWDVGFLASKNSVLLMWIPDTHIEEGLELGKAWGFQYKTKCFTWVKTVQGYETMIKQVKELEQRNVKQLQISTEELISNLRPRMGMGLWSRKETEACYIFVKGKPKRISNSVREVILARRDEHSKKPEIVKNYIEELIEGPYLELFARTKTRLAFPDKPNKSWYYMGNEISGKSLNDEIEELKKGN